MTRLLRAFACFVLVALATTAALPAAAQSGSYSSGEIIDQGNRFFGGNGDRVMMLVYNLPDVSAVYQRYAGVAGSAYVVAGFGMTALGRNGIYVVPIVSGVGARLGVNFGYLKFTDRPTWNPF